MEATKTKPVAQGKRLFTCRPQSEWAAGCGTLTLRALPTLLTDCVLIGHAEKADVVFTPPQWFAMCAHMMNENPNTTFS